MTRINRRHFLTSAAGATALGLSGNLAFAPAAMADELREVGYFSYWVGDIEVISIYDGIFERPTEMGFVVDQEPDELRAALRAGGYSDAFVPVEFAFTALGVGGRTILIDAGTGGQLFPSAGLAANGGLARAGIMPEDVDVVLVSHMHRDHVSGMIDPETSALVFPNAEVMVGETEYAFWTDAATIARLPEARRQSVVSINEAFQSWAGVSRFVGGQEVLPGITAIDSFGHTPGHTTFQVTSGDDELLLIGDAILLPALFMKHLDWLPIADMDGPTGRDTRRGLIDRAVADGAMIAGYHFGFPNAGQITTDGSTFAFEPISV